MRQPAILCLVWEGFVPILERYLAEHGPLTLLTLSPYVGNGLAALAAKYQCQLLPVERLLEPQVQQGVTADAKRVARAGQDYFAGSEWTTRPQPKGKADLATILAAAMDADLPPQLGLLCALERAAELYAIKLTLVIEDFTCLPRTAVLWSRQRRIPSLHFLHGVALTRPYTVHRELQADVLAVYGQRSLETYLDQGIAADRCRIVGNPVWDDLIALRPQRAALRGALCAKYGLDPGLPIITFATTWAANLTAVLSEDMFGTTVAAFLAAVKELRAQGLAVSAVIKDRAASAHLGIDKPRVDDIAAELGLTPQDYVYTKEDGRDWVVASDILVGVDSNILVEAMMVATPAVNILSDALCRLGPSFDADCGVQECEAPQLAPTLMAILRDAPLRMALLAQLQAAAPHYNAGVDGKAAARLCALMVEMALPSEPAPGAYVWQTLIDAENTDASQYHGWAQTQLFELFSHPPRRLLDIGCGAGATGAAVKQVFPAATVFGIELNRAAAQAAAQRLDHVATGRFEDIDLEALGIAPGSLDTVIVADVLEHMYDPWGVLVRLRPYLTADAQIIASIPNIRNLVAMEGLAQGNWRYEAFGLLDVTHIRFFTAREIRRFFHETGYRVSHSRFNPDPRLVEFHDRQRRQGGSTVEYGRMILKDVSSEELSELCALQVYVRAEPGALAEAEFKAQESGGVRSDYSLWQQARTLQANEGELWDKYIATWPSQPQVHLVITASGKDDEAISRSLNSAARQLYPHLAITVLGNAPPPAEWRDSERLRWRHAGGEMVAAINAALLMQAADWVGVIDAGDQLAAHTLLFLLQAAQAQPAWRLIYSDEDSLADNGERRLPNFKPDFNLDLLRSYPYVGGLMLIARDCFAELGGFDPTLAGIEDYDLVLRAVERVGDQGIGHVAEVLLHRGEKSGHSESSLADLCAAGRTAVAAHLRRQGIPARLEPGLLPLAQRVDYEHAATPLVSVLVVVKDGLERLQRALESLFAKTRYAPIELLVLEANSADPALRQYVESLEGLGVAWVRAFHLGQDATLAAYHNLLADQAQGEYLLFLHADATALQEDWLDVLMAQAQRPEIGAVAPRLLNADGSVRRTAMILGLGGAADSPFLGAPMDAPGYFGRALIEQDVSALGAGALLTRAADFRAAGGFDATLAVDAAEVDYCLRLTGNGLRLLWTPHASLLCEGGAAGVDWGAAAADGEALRARWLQRLGCDPAYNRNLRLVGGAAFVVEPRTTLNWDPLPWRPLPRILAHAADNMGCGQYRILAPMRALKAAGRVQGWSEYSTYDPVELAHLELDSLVFQRQVTDHEIDALERHQRYSAAFRVFELDDLLEQLPGRSVHNQTMPKDIAERLRRAVPMCQRMVVSTEPLAHAYRGLSGDIRVVPNYLERALWGELRSGRRGTPRPRVGWVGGLGHSGDLEMIADVVRELAGEVDWVFMGMCPDALRPHVREFHGGAPYNLYPQKMASLDLDLALAPLEVNAFNEGKSNLRILEYGTIGLPVICSDIYPYQGDFPVTRVRNRSLDWARAIREHVADRAECARRGELLRQHVQAHWMLDDHLDVWLQAWLP